jgi:chloramphenicol 3-O phosphotransferase
MRQPEQHAVELVQSLLAAVRRHAPIRPFLADTADEAAVVRQLGAIATSPGAQPGEPLVDGRRVDVPVSDDDGREWWMVLQLTADSTPRVEAVSVFERPAPFDGLRGGFVVVLRGPSSSGKSSLMTAFCDLAETPWLAFDEPIVGRLPLRFAIWPDASGPIGQGFFGALGALARTGNQVITSSGTHPQQQFRSALIDVPTLFVGLECPPALLLERERSRSDRWAGATEESLARLDSWDYDLRIDTSAHGPAAAARRLLAHVAAVRGGRPV